MGEVERLAACGCGHPIQDHFGGCDFCACSNTHALALAAHVAAARADEREDWASWLENWQGAVGPEPPTIDAVIRWLRAESRPFGRAAALLAETPGSDT